MRITTINVLAGILSLLIIGCGGGSTTKSNTKSDSKDYKSVELLKAQKISGVYTGTADINYTILGVIQEDDKLTVSINHSGNDDSKQLIVRVVVNKYGQALCALYSNLTIDSNNQFQGKITHSGQVGDAKAVYSVTLVEKKEDVGEGKEESDDPSVILKIAEKPEVLAFEAENINGLTKTNKPVLSFDELHNLCF